MGGGGRHRQQILYPMSPAMCEGPPEELAAASQEALVARYPFW